jgi:hypothetical protein
MHPEHYRQIREGLKHALSPFSTDLERATPALRQFEHETRRWLAKGGGEKIFRWLRPAEHAISEHRSQFWSVSPLSYNVYGPPEAPYPPLRSLKAVLDLLPAHIRDDAGAKALIGEGMRLNALQVFLDKEQTERITPTGVHTYMPIEASSGGLGDTSQSDDEAVTDKPLSRKAKSRLAKERAARGRRKRIDVEDDLHTTALTPVTLAELERLLTLVSVAQTLHARPRRLRETPEPVLTRTFPPR